MVMAKREKWMDLTKGIEGDLKHFGTLTDRELVIIGAATIDAGLAHLIEKRLVQNKGRITKFLNLDGSSAMSPAGGFSARIQLAYLTGILAEAEYTAIDSIRRMRNIAAHQVNISLQDNEIEILMDKVTVWVIAVLRGGLSGQEKNSVVQWHDKIKAVPAAYAKTMLVYAFALFNTVSANKDKIIKPIKKIGET